MIALQKITALGQGLFSEPYTKCWALSLNIFFFFVFFVDWNLLRWQLFAYDDGSTLEWTSIALLAWGRPFDVTVINPLQGMVSQFIPWNPFFNPSLAVLSLPIGYHSARLVAFAILWAEVFSSIYFLARALAMSRLVSLLAAQVLVLISFPGFNFRFTSDSWGSWLPLSLHMLALNALVFTLFIEAGRKSVRTDILLAIATVLVFVLYFYTAPLFLLAHLPVIIAFLVAFLVAYGRSRWKIALNLATLGVTVVLFWALGFVDYLDLTVRTAARYLYLDHPQYGLNIGLVDAWNRFNPCTQGLIKLIGKDCLADKQLLPNYLALFGAVMAIFTPRLRWVGLAVIGFFGGLYLFNVLAIMGVLRNPSSHTLWLYYTGKPLIAIFAVFGIAAVASGFRSVVAALTGGRASSVNALLFDRFGPVAAMAIVPIFAFSVALDDHVSRKLSLGTYLSHDVSAIALPGVRLDPRENVTPIVQELIDNIRIRPGETFRGSASSYFGDTGSPAWSVIAFPAGVTPSHLFSTNYAIRFYYAFHYGNMHTSYHLWYLGVPTFEEYSQWTAPGLVGLASYLFANRNTMQSANQLLIRRLDFPALRAMGVRYIVSDQLLSDSRVTLRRTLRKPEVLPIYLYELTSPNLGQFSPTEFTVILNAAQATDRLRTKGFDWRRQVILTRAPGNAASLVPLKAARISFPRGRIRVQAESPGRSMALLPVNFTHCFKIADFGDSAVPKGIEMLRANVTQTAVLFDRRLDITLENVFNPPGDMSCRARDLKDLQDMAVFKAFKFKNGTRTRP